MIITSLTSVGNLLNVTSAENTLNTNFTNIALAFQDALSVSSTTNNQMKAPLDLNSNQIINLPIPATANSPLRLQDLSNFLGSGTVSSLPAGGATGQALVKSSNTNYATTWGNLISGVTASNASLTIATVAGAVTASLNVNNPNIWGGTQTFIAPVLGAATATSINKVQLTQPASGSVLTIPDGVTLTGPATSGTAMTLGNAETVTGVKTYGSAGAVGRFKLAGTTSGSTVVDATAVASGTVTIPAVTDTLIGKATTDTLTNKTFNTAATGNVLQINGTTITANTGTGSNVLATTPTLVTPVLGVATATSVNFGGDSLANYISSGTWTPTDASGAGLVFTGANARYTRIGNLVFAYGRLTFPSTANAASNIIGGLPIAVANATYANPPGTLYGTSGNTNAHSISPNVNLTTFSITKANGATALNSDLTTMTLIFNVIYPVT